MTVLRNMSVRNRAATLVVLSLLLPYQYCAAQVQCGTASWTIAVPNARRDIAGATDTNRGRFVMFGHGFWGPQGTPMETWEWDGGAGAWSLRAIGGPGVRGSTAMAYDGGQEQIVLFGGYSGNTYFADTWIWDPARSTWTIRTTTGGPPARVGHAMAFDAARAKIVMFGGGGSNGQPAGDTWEWDGATATWTQRSTGGPGARTGHTMAYDGVHQRVIMCGGFGYDDSVWEWDGIVGSWTQRAVHGPGTRSSACFAIDPVDLRAFYFGGNGDAGNDLNDMWNWDGTGGGAWTLRSNGGPLPRDRFALGSDSATGKIVLFGGYSYVLNSPNYPHLGDTWEWDAGTGAWNQRLACPRGREYSVMAFDRDRGSVVMFGGRIGGADVGPAIGETWELGNGGRAWTLRSQSGPTARYISAMVYDTLRQRAVLFGGTPDFSQARGDTWEWDGSTGTWALRATTGPPARFKHAMAFDRVRGRVVLFGGTNGTAALGDTWEWDGGSGSWTQRVPTGSAPAPRSYHGMAQAGSDGRIVLFGGSNDSGTYNSDTWEWNGGAGTWTNRTSPGPSARSRFSIVYDVARLRAVLFGGGDGTHVSGDTWEWNSLAGTWTQLGTSGSARYRHVAAYDEQRDRLVMFGGQTLCVCAESLDDTQECVIPAAPLISQIPHDLTVAVGQSAALTVVATGAGPLAFQWQQNGVPVGNGPRISGATTAALVIAPALLADAGSYRVVVSNSCGPSTSLPASLVVQCPVDIDHNGVVDPSDVAAFINIWFSGLTTGDLQADFDGNGVLQPADVALFVTAWLGGVNGAC